MPISTPPGDDAHAQSSGPMARLLGEASPPRRPGRASGDPARRPLRPATETSTRSILRFAGFELDVALRELRRGGQVLPLRRKPMAVLEYLIEHRRRVVPRRELLERVWAGVVVDERALTSAIRDLRRVLRAHGDEHEIVVTRRGFGYLFRGELERVAVLGPPAIAQRRRAPHPIG